MCGPPPGPRASAPPVTRVRAVLVKYWLHIVCGRSADHCLPVGADTCGHIALYAHRLVHTYYYLLLGVCALLHVSDMHEGVAHHDQQAGHGRLGRPSCRSEQNAACVPLVACTCIALQRNCATRIKVSAPGLGMDTGPDKGHEPPKTSMYCVTNAHVQQASYSQHLQSQLLD